MHLLYFTQCYLKKAGTTVTKGKICKTLQHYRLKSSFAQKVKLKAFIFCPLYLAHPPVSLGEVIRSSGHHINGQNHRALLFSRLFNFSDYSLALKGLLERSLVILIIADLPFPQLIPQVFNGIQVWRNCRPFYLRFTSLKKPFPDDETLMSRSIVAQEDEIRPVLFM